MGQTELDRLYNAGQVLNNISPNWQERLQAAIGADVFDRVKDQSLDQLSPEDHQKVIVAMGRFAQNRLYRQLLLSKISELWVEYLTQVEALRVSVRMEAYGQRDPLVQYRGQASEMFTQLLSDIRAGVIDQMSGPLVSREELKKIQQNAQQANNPNAPAAEDNKKKKSRKRH